MRIVSRCFLVTAAVSLFSYAAMAQTGSTPPPAPADALPDAPSVTAQITVAPLPTGPFAVIDTSMGRLTCQLFSKESPLATENFVGLANGTKAWTDPVSHQKVTGKPFYNGTTFHRVIPGFMIQGGDRLGDGSGDAGYFFPNETTPGLTFDIPGRLAMANAGRDTNGTQFFVTVAPQPALNGGYTIFGQCDQPSIDVATSIAGVPRNGSDKPDTAVTIKEVTIVPVGAAMPPLPPGPKNITPENQPPIGPPRDPAPGRR